MILPRRLIWVTAQRKGRKGEHIVTPRVIFFDINETLLDMQAIKTALAAVLNGDETLVDLWFANLLHHSLVCLLYTSPSPRD